MKGFFDTNVYVAEALLGEAAERMVKATHDASWRIYTCREQLEELERVLTDELGFSRRLAYLSRIRILRRATLVQPGASRHEVSEDPQDNLILQAAPPGSESLRRAADRFHDGFPPDVAIRRAVTISRSRQN